MSRDVITRALMITELFRSRDVTIKELSEHLEISKQMGRRWMVAASLVLPITEVGMKFTGGRGKPPIIYGMMK
jgi:hypothetical protein